MLYQFIDWRLGLSRVMFCGNIEDALKKLRDLNRGVLPTFLSTWDEIRSFCSAFCVPIHENENIAKSITYSENHPTLKWVRDEYDKFIKYLSEEAPELLVDPKVETTTLNRPSFLGEIESSVSNTKEKPCLVPSPPISLISSTLDGLLNSSVTATKAPSQPPRR